MQPRSNGYESKWRIFHPQATVWVQNPFDHEIVFQVADEHNVPYSYKMPAHKVSELPGGAVATLGVKAIVDETLLTTAPTRIWEAAARQKVEDDIIMREKQATMRTSGVTPETEIDLSIDGDVSTETEEIEDVVETEFPGLNPQPSPVETQSSQEVANIAAASVAGKPNATIETD